MDRDWSEELLMIVIALAMLSFLLPFSMPRNIVAMLAVAISLIILLVMLSVSWQREEETPFDIVIVIGIALSFIYLVTFYAFEGGALNAAVLTIFAAYYVLMAVLLHQYRSASRSAVYPRTHIAAHTPAARTTERTEERVVERRRTPHVHSQTATYHMNASESHYDPSHDPQFKRGIRPIPERAPPPVHRRSIFHRIFWRGVRPIPEHAPPHHVPHNDFRGHETSREIRRESHTAIEYDAERSAKQESRRIEPIPEVKRPEPAKRHSGNFNDGIEPLHETTMPSAAKKHPSSFSEGIEPIHGLTDEDIRKLEIYDLKPAKGSALKKSSRKRK